MRLHGKQLLILVGDGVDQGEFLQLKNGFEEEGASVLVTTPQEDLSIETVESNRRGGDILIDIPFEVVMQNRFDGLILPDGILAVDSLRKDPRVFSLIEWFHLARLPIFASGHAVQLLYDSKVLFDQIVIREGTPISHFLDKAVGVLLDQPESSQLYRSTIAA